MNNWKKLLTAGVLVTATIGLTACAPGNSNAYDPEIKANFMNSCETSSGGLTAYCECVWDAVSNKFTQAEFTVIDKWFADGTGEVSQEDQDFITNSFTVCAAAHVPQG